MYNPKEIYKKYNKGDDLSDDELEYGLTFFEDLENKLRMLGPEFTIAWKEVVRICDGLGACKFARNGMKDL
jgi:hypothetical protein